MVQCSLAHDCLRISRPWCRELLDINNDLSNQIKTFDTDLQMLVYENYSKFIAATDVIKQMKVCARRRGF